MENATMLMPPSTGLSGILLSSEPNILEGPEDKKNINTISMHGEKFYQLHTETRTLKLWSYCDNYGISIVQRFQYFLILT